LNYKQAGREPALLIGLPSWMSVPTLESGFVASIFRVFPNSAVAAKEPKLRVQVGREQPTLQPLTVEAFMKTTILFGISLALLSGPAVAQYARSGQTAGGYRGGDIPATSSISNKRYAALEGCTAQAQSQVRDTGQSSLSRDRYYIYRACMTKSGMRP
jgi:hypothetical protein